MITTLRCFLTATAATLAASTAMAQPLSAPQVEAIATFWDLAYDCADGSGACDDIAAAVRNMNRLGICPDENRLADCASIGAESGGTALPESASVANMVAVIIPDSPTGLATITPEWHAAIAAGQCLTEAGFGECLAYSPPRLSAGDRGYEGFTVDESKLLTRWNVYAEECRGAVGQANIDGWCGARDQARDALKDLGLCLFDTGFGSCARANANPETVPFDAATVEAEFMKLSADRRRFLQAMISAGGADGNFGPRTATSLRSTAKQLEDITARDPRPERFDLSSVEGVQAYLKFLQEPLTEAMIWGGG
jgi:hypothetical protein